MVRRYIRDGDLVADGATLLSSALRVLSAT